MNINKSWPKLRLGKLTASASLTLICLLFGPTGTVGASGCVAPTNYPPPGTGGMSYVNWYFNSSQSLSTVQASVNLDNDPGNTSDEYLQIYDANIDNTGQYFGIQTTGLALFSEWGTSDTSNIQLGPGSYLTNGTEVGSAYISLRHNFGSLPAGHYSVQVSRGNYDGTGDWFNYYVTFPGQSQTYIGAVRFPRANPAVPASFHDGGGTWTEFWDNNNPTTLYPVPLWQLNVAITANNNLVPNSAISSYSSMPNSDTYALSPGGYVNYTIGGTTARCHPAGYLWQNLNDAKSAPAPAPETTQSTSHSSATATTQPAAPASTPSATASPSVTAPALKTPTQLIIQINGHGKALSNVDVVFNNDQKAITNKQGLATFAIQLSPGSYPLRATAPGYHNLQTQVSLTASPAGPTTQHETFSLTANDSSAPVYLSATAGSLLALGVFAVWLHSYVGGRHFKNNRKGQAPIPGLVVSTPPVSSWQQGLSTVIHPDPKPKVEKIEWSPNPHSAVGQYIVKPQVISPSDPGFTRQVDDSKQSLR